MSDATTTLTRPTAAPTQPRQPSSRTLVFGCLALLTLSLYTAPRWNDWNQISRVNLVQAIVDRGTVQIDAYAANTGDYAFYQSHYYSDKPPGPALAGVLPYAGLKLALSNSAADWVLERLGRSGSISQAFSRPDQPPGPAPTTTTTTTRDKIIGAVARIWLSFWLVSVPTAIMLGLFWVWTGRISSQYWASLLLTLALGLGTTLFPYTSLFYNHALCAALLFISFYILHSLKVNPRSGLGQAGRLWLVGFLLGFSVISQYETVLIAGALGLYALATAPVGVRWRYVGWLGLGAAPCAVGLVAYDWLAFGSLWPIGYQYSTLWLDRHSQGFMSLTYPHLDALWGLTFSPYRGLFLLSPFLLLALPGFYFGWRQAAYRLEILVCGWAGLTFWLFNASSNMWWGGHTFGPRYLVPCLPFVAFGVVFMLQRARGWFVGLAVLSIGLVLPASLAGRQWPSDTYQNPLTDYLWPQLWAGNLARNPGSAVGLKGFASYGPLLVGLGFLYIVIYRWPVRRPKADRATNGWLRFSSLTETHPLSLEPRPTPGNKPTPDPARPDDRRFAGLVVGLVLVLTSLPYLFGYWRTPTDKMFMGIMLDVPDTTQYWGWMREMGQHWLIVNPLTPEPNDPVFFNALWLGLGQLQRWTGLEPAVVYQLFRLASLIFFGLVAWGFCSQLFERRLFRRTAFVLIMLGSGWGWISILVKQFTGTLSNPLSVFVAEPNSFLSALAFPHLLFSSGLMLGIFWLALKAAQTSQLKWASYAAGLALFLGLEHTYDLLIVYTVLGAYAGLVCWERRRLDWQWFKIGLVIGLVSSPPSLYFVYLTATNPTWKGVLAQYGNAGVFTPDPFNLLILMGPGLLLAVVGLWANPARPDQTALYSRWRFVKVWFVVNSLLIYIPTNFQIKMLTGWQIPIWLLSVAALTELPSRWPRLVKLVRSERMVAVVLICIALPTTLYLFSWRFLDLNRTQAPYYLPRDEIAAMTWLEQASPSPQVVLASEELGQYLATRTGQRPFLAHWAMTLDYYTKQRLSAEVLDPRTAPDHRAAILREYRVKFVLYATTEKRLAPQLSDPNLQRVFSSPGADVYRFEATE